MRCVLIVQEYDYGVGYAKQNVFFHDGGLALNLPFFDEYEGRLCVTSGSPDTLTRFPKVPQSSFRKNGAFMSFIPQRCVSSRI